MMELRGKRKATREANLKLAEGLDDGNWIKVTPYHWRRTHRLGHRVDFWPTTMKAQFSWFDAKAGAHDTELVENAYEQIDAYIKKEEEATYGK